MSVDADSELACDEGDDQAPEHMVVAVPEETPEHLPESIGQFTLAEVSDERTVWRRTRTAPAGDYKSEFIVFQQYSGWRVKHRYNVKIPDEEPGGYRYYDNEDASRSTFEDREAAEQTAITQLQKRAE